MPVGFSCQHCLACTESNQDSPLYLRTLLEFSYARPWWPNQLPSPTLYFALRRRLQYTTIDPRDSSPWRPSSQALPHVPSLLLITRHHLPLSVLVPVACTNIKPEECSVQYSRTIYVTLQQPRRSHPSACRRVRPRAAMGGSNEAAPRCPHTSPPHDHVQTKSRRPPLPPHPAHPRYLPSNVCYSSSLGEVQLSCSLYCTEVNLAPGALPCRAHSSGRRTSHAERAPLAAPALGGSRPAYQPHAPGGWAQGNAQVPHGCSPVLPAANQGLSAHSVQHHPWTTHPTFAQQQQRQQQQLEGQASCLSEEIQELLQELEGCSRVGGGQLHSSSHVPLLVDHVGGSGSPTTSPWHVCLEVGDEPRAGPRCSSLYFNAALTEPWVGLVGGLKRKTHFVN